MDSRSLWPHYAALACALSLLVPACSDDGGNTENTETSDTSGDGDGDPTGDGDGDPATGDGDGDPTGDGDGDPTGDGDGDPTGDGDGDPTGDGDGDPLASTRLVVVGQTDSLDLLSAANNYLGGPLDGFIASIELDGRGSSIEFAEYVGGNDYEQLRDVALDANGRACVAGRMASTNLATTDDALQSSYGGGGMDSFLICWDEAGATLYSSYFGGDNYDVGYGLSIDEDGGIVMSGRTSSSNLPTTPGAFQTDYAGGQQNQQPYFGGDYFVFRFSPGGDSIVWGSFIGGSNDDAGRGRNAIANDGAIWVGGRTQSQNFPVTMGSLQGQSDGGVARLSADGSTLEMGTFIGGSDPLDAATGGLVALDDGSAIVCGYTNSADFPAPNNAAQPDPGGGFDGAVYHLAADGTVLAASYLGGSNYEECQGVDVDSEGNVYVIGLTNSPDFPFTSGSLSGPSDMYLAKLNPEMTSFEYAIPVGGSGEETADASRVWVTQDGRAVLTAATTSDDLPFTLDAVQAERGGGQDVMLAIVSADGTGFDYLSYFGGSGDDFPRAIAVLEQ